MSNIVPLQPHPIHPLRSLKQFAAKADRIIPRYEQIAKLLDRLDTLSEKVEATTNREIDDQLIADAKRIAVLDDHDRALLSWCRAALRRLDPDDAYEIDDDEKYHLKPSVVAPRVAVVVGAFPSGSPADPAVYLKVMMEHVCSDAALSLPTLDAAIWEVTGSLKFLPSACELMVIVKRQIQQWGRRFVAIHNIAELSHWTLADIEALAANRQERDDG